MKKEKIIGFSIFIPAVIFCVVNILFEFFKYCQQFLFYFGKLFGYEIGRLIFQNIEIALLSTLFMLFENIFVLTIATIILFILSNIIPIKA